MRRVVITGIGPICAGRRGKEDFWEMLLQKRPLLRPVPPDFERHYSYKTRYFVPAPEVQGYGKNVDALSALALACTGLALEDAGLESLCGGGVVLGVGMGFLGAAFPSHLAHVSGAGRFNRLVIPMSMPNAPAACIALEYGADRECHTLNAACASGTVAIGEAYRKIASGVLDLALTGGVDRMDDPDGAILRGFDSLRALTAAPDGLPRPFSNTRSGFLFNRGAGCVLVLEELERARARGATIYAEITGYACNTGAGNIVQLSEDITGLLRLFEMAKGHQVDYLNAHGTGTEQNDRVEREVIRALWGEQEHQPFINSTKGIVGHSIGASGALELAATALSVHTGRVHGNLTEDVMEGLRCPLEPQELEVSRALSASYGFGGHNALLMVERVVS